MSRKVRDDVKGELHPQNHHISYALKFKILRDVFTLPVQDKSDPKISFGKVNAQGDNGMLCSAAESKKSMILTTL